jgi:hypothetical protein
VEQHAPLRLRQFVGPQEVLGIVTPVTALLGYGHISVEFVESFFLQFRGRQAADRDRQDCHGEDGPADYSQAEHSQ